MKASAPMRGSDARLQSDALQEIWDKMVCKSVTASVLAETLQLTWNVFSHDLEGGDDVWVVQVKGQCSLLWHISSSKSRGSNAVHLLGLDYLQSRKMLA